MAGSPVSQVSVQNGSNKDNHGETTNSPTRRANLRVKTLEIRWHDSKPISSCDFQPRPLKRARPIHHNPPASGSAAALGTQQETCYKLATAGEDNNVRVSLRLHGLKYSHGNDYCRFGWFIRT
jgi:hypothetical protein